MLLNHLAERHSLRVRRSRHDDSENIDGRLGEIYEYGDSELALMLCVDPPALVAGLACEVNASRLA